MCVVPDLLFQPGLAAKQSQLPQPLLIRLLLQTLHQLRCPSLDTLQHLNVLLVLRGPKLNTVFKDAIGFLGRLGTLLAHIHLAVNQHPQVLLCWAAFQPLFPKAVALHGVAVAQVQDLALIQPVQVPLQSLPTLQQINTPAQLGVICKLAESALDPFVQIIDKDVKQNWPQHQALGNTTCDQPPTGVNSIHHHSLGPAVQPVLYPAKSTPVQAMSSQFLQENVATAAQKLPCTKAVSSSARDLACCSHSSSAQTTESSVSNKVMETHETQTLIYSTEAYKVLATTTITVVSVWVAKEPKLRSEVDLGVS
ncbi:hypothetical protein QYF61_000444 [Mycteria americana]|uniref:Uncharacterized protein n=1 Tax=Mycteria americana TaxID=33587 RepID=A0AAN7NEC5_MYCAM|nr:hypothetical protein QYF61_000444 [Mycteria americana]